MAIGDSQDTTTVPIHGAVLRFLKSHPIRAAVILVFAIVITELVTGSYFHVSDFKSPLYLYRKHNAQKAAHEIVDQMLAEIGHGVEIDAIFGQRLVDTGCVATYNPGSRVITFDVEAPYRGFSFLRGSLMRTLGHECAHALFAQAELLPESYRRSGFILAEEISADVFSAHIVGRVITAGGGNGERVTRMLLGLYRSDCLGDQDKPPSHRVPVEIINDMNRICRDSPDLWKAAHIIAEKYFVVDKSGEWKYRDGLNPTPKLPTEEPKL